MRGFFAEEQKRHEPQKFMVAGVFRASAEQAERADRLLAGARAAGLEMGRPAERGLGAVAAIHTPAYLRFLQTIHGRWQAVDGASDEVLPNVHLDRTLGGYPRSPVGLAAFHQADTACPIGQHTWEAACWSAGSLPARIEMKMMLSMPRTISSTVSVSSATQASGLVSQSNGPSVVSGAPQATS